METILPYIGWILLVISVAFIFAYKKMSNNPNALTGKYSTTLPIYTDPELLSGKITGALKKAGFKKIGKDIEEERYFAKAGFSIWSFAEYIEVSIQQQHNGPVLFFSSICALPTQVIDWGKNERNAEKFLKAFNEELASA